MTNPLDITDPVVRRLAEQVVFWMKSRNEINQQLSDSKGYTPIQVRVPSLDEIIQQCHDYIYLYQCECEVHFEPGTCFKCGEDREYTVPN